LFFRIRITALHHAFSLAVFLPPGRTLGSDIVHLPSTAKKLFAKKDAAFKMCR
jgi:hypothetical protein